MKTLFRKNMSTLSIMSVFGISINVADAAVADATQRQAGIHQSGVVTTIVQENSGSAADNAIDYRNAMPMPLPKSNRQPVVEYGRPTAGATSGAPGHSQGSRGSGIESPVYSPQPIPAKSDSAVVTPDEYGTSGHPYTTSLVNAYGEQSSKYYPNRASGKLYFKIGSSTYVCSASMIKPGVVVTAAHCVAGFNSTFYSHWKFHPAQNNTSNPYGIWDAASATVMTSYFNGTDSCAVAGVVCQNDVAVLRLVPKTDSSGAPYYAGNRAGWYAYGWNGYSSTPFLGNTTYAISQLGYPQNLDSGVLMERTDSLGYMNTSFSNNTVIGSLQGGGSSGGPWMANLGMTPTLTGATEASADLHNTVVGVTSWGYTDGVYNEMGASEFTDGNIVPLVNAVCGANPEVC